MLTVCSRKEFARITGISENTLKLWEEPTKNRRGITQKGALRLIEAVKYWGISCTLEWIMHGIGTSPTVASKNKPQETTLENISWGEEESILKDIESFKLNNPNPIVIRITDGSVLPYYQYGDYVGGCKRIGKEIDSLIGSLCIIELSQGAVIRRITAKNHEGRFDLSIINNDKSVLQPNISDINILSAAKIIWHRSRENIKNIIV